MDETQLIIIGNELDSDGWALIAPYGEWPKFRVAKVNGIPTEQKFLQVLDNASADKLMDKESGLFRSLKRALVGSPVYLGHPDLVEHSPETLANVGRKQDGGVVDKVRKADRGIEAHFVLNQVGATAVENGAKFPSALWLVLPNGQVKNGAIVCHPFKLLSVGLTDRPNIAGVESLANTQEKENIMLREYILGALIGGGVPLENEATDQQIMQIIANGDYPGHPFHGNQYSDGSAGTTSSNRASRAAAAASHDAAQSGSKEDHQKAEIAHRKAAAAANKAGNKKLALYHDMMHNMHGSAAKGK